MGGRETGVVAGDRRFDQVDRRDCGRKITRAASPWPRSATCAAKRRGCGCEEPDPSLSKTTVAGLSALTVRTSMAGHVPTVVWRTKGAMTFECQLEDPFPPVATRCPHRHATELHRNWPLCLIGQASAGHPPWCHRCRPSRTTISPEFTFRFNRRRLAGSWPAFLPTAPVRRCST